MKLALRLPTDCSRGIPKIATGAGLVRFAQAAEAAGFDAVYEADHPFPSAKWMDSGGHRDYDPMVALAYIASRTSKIRLQTKIYVLAYRNPFASAKMISTLDQLSGGRLTLGIGSGYLRSEFAALGVDYSRRGDLTDRAIKLMRRAWTGEVVAGDADGSVFIPGNVQWPQPAQRPHPPLWIGGNSRAAIRRAVSIGDGWIPTPNTDGGHSALMRDVKDLRSALSYMAEIAEALDRPVPMDVQTNPFRMDRFTDTALDAGAILDELAELAGAGVTSVSVQAPGATEDEIHASIEWYAQRVIPESNRLVVAKN